MKKPPENHVTLQRCHIDSTNADLAMAENLDMPKDEKQATKAAAHPTITQNTIHH